MARKFTTTFADRNSILEDEWGWLPVATPEEYFTVLFSREQPDGTVKSYLQETGDSHYGDRYHNAVVYHLREGKTAAKYDITRSLDKCAMLHGINDGMVISSPNLYIGRSRKGERLRSVWGIAIDLDLVSNINLADMYHWVYRLEILPKPSMIVSSGSGLHLYYLFSLGVRTTPNAVKALNRLKWNMTKYIWNSYFSSDESRQYQNVLQGFRIPGTPTKDGDRVVGFTPEEIPYYTADQLDKCFPGDEMIRGNKPLSTDEIESIDDNPYNYNRLRFEEAKKKYPDWNPDKKNELDENGKRRGRGRYTCQPQLYYSWLDRLKRHDSAVKQGHRYSCIMTLVAFGLKCDIPVEQVRQDALGLVDWLDSLTTAEQNHFTRQDVEDALVLYREDQQERTVRYTRRSIEFLTGIRFEAKKRRNPEERRITREQAFQMMKAVRKVKADQGVLQPSTGRKTAKDAVVEWRTRHPYNNSKAQCARDCGITVKTVTKWWRTKNKTIPQTVLEWREAHPEGSKYKCSKDCGLAYNTVTKWWDCNSGDILTEEERLERIREKGLSAIKEKSKSTRAEPPEELLRSYRTAVSFLRSPFGVALTLDEILRDIVEKFERDYPDFKEKI